MPVNGEYETCGYQFSNFQNCPPPGRSREGQGALVL
jgi:hypothetical protein